MKITRKGWYILGGFTALLFIANALPDRPRPAPTVTETPKTPKCTKTLGHFYSGIKIYSDSDCTNLLGTVLGASKVDGQSTVRIEYASGDIEDKLRSVVGQQTYVMDNDPALSKREWLEFK